MNILNKLKNYLFGYSFIKPLAEGKSYSTNILLRRNLTGSLWAGKISRPLPDRIENFQASGKPYIRTVDFRDFDDRATLGFRLAQLAGIRTLRTKIITDSQVGNFNNVQITHGRVNSKIFLAEFKGQSLPDYLASNSFSSIESSGIKNKDEIIKSFVFHLWIGNYDNKDADNLVDKDGNYISVDYHESGPGFKDNIALSLGGWGEAFDLKDPGDTAWCLDGGQGFIWHYVVGHKPKLETFLPAINKILSISENSIKQAMSGLNFFIQGTSQNINREYFNFLLERRTKLKTAIQTWINAGFPYSPRPKDNGIQ